MSSINTGKPSAPEGAEVLRFENVSIGTQEIMIDRDITFSVREGEILGIIGESGCGKSTLLRSVLHLRGDENRVRGGQIYWKGKRMIGMPVERVRALAGSEIAIIYQSLSAAFDPISRVREQYLEAMRCHNRRVTQEQMREKASQLLREVNLTDAEGILNAYPFELSGGMLQRAAIVMAMLNDPELIMADEITSALDNVSKEQVIDALLKIREYHQTAIVLVTHDMSVIRRAADTVAVMYGGRIVEQGSREAILNGAAHPYTKALLRAIPGQGHSLPEAIPGKPPAFEKEMNFCPFHPRCSAAEAVCGNAFPEETELEEETFAAGTAAHKVRCFACGRQ